jgi:hypothetical protein
VTAALKSKFARDRLAGECSGRCLGRAERFVVAARDARLIAACALWQQCLDQRRRPSSGNG